MVDLGQDSRNYKTTEGTQSSANLDDCYCCGQPAIVQVRAIGFPGVAKIGLCWNCCEGQFEFVNGYLEFTCPFCDPVDMAGMVYYWKAITVFNEHTGQKKHGKAVGRKGVWKKVNWETETEKLREKYVILTTERRI